VRGFEGESEGASLARRQAMERELIDRAEMIHERLLQLRDSL
jgi:hypothetical protein